jgi:hypothetical protein
LHKVLEILFAVVVVFVIWWLFQRAGWLLALILGVSVVGLSSCSKKTPVSEYSQPQPVEEGRAPPMV